MNDSAEDDKKVVKDVGPLFGWFGFCFTLALWIVALTLILYFSGRGSAVGDRILGYGWFYVPAFFAEKIQVGGLFGLFWLMALASVYWAGIAVLFAGAAYAVGRAVLSWRKQKNPDRKAEANKPVLRGPPASFLGIRSTEASIVLSPMGSRGPEFRNVFPSGSLCLSRIAVKSSRAPKTPLERFELALMEVLAAHRDWTSDPDGHHANVGLLDHSQRVAQRMKDLMPGDALARPLGLAHDLGKILAYGRRTRQDGTSYWEKKTMIQDRLSAQLVRMLPEFWSLPEQDRATVNIVLTYTHSPGKLPRKSTSVRARTLLEKLREADGLTSAQDRQQATANAGKEPVLLDIIRVLPDAIAALNINQALHPDANADGWTLMALDYVAVQADRMREGLRGLVSESTSMSISLNAENYATPIHPATVAIRESLERMGLLMTEFNGIAPEEALFSIRAFKSRFERIFLLNRDRLGQLLGAERLERWGDSRYDLKVLGASENRRKAGAGA